MTVYSLWWTANQSDLCQTSLTNPQLIQLAEKGVSKVEATVFYTSETRETDARYHF